MWHLLKDLWQHNRRLLIAFGVALCALGFFGVRSVSHLIYWADPRHQDQPLARWMTPRFVARSYDVPPAVVQDAFFLDKGGPPVRVSVEKITSHNDISIAELQERLDEIVAIWRAEHPAQTP